MPVFTYRRSLRVCMNMMIKKTWATLHGFVVSKRHFIFNPPRFEPTHQKQAKQQQLGSLTQTRCCARVGPLDTCACVWCCAFKGTGNAHTSPPNPQVSLLGWSWSQSLWTGSLRLGVWVRRQFDNGLCSIDSCLNGQYKRMFEGLFIFQLFLH